MYYIKIMVPDATSHTNRSLHPPDHDIANQLRTSKAITDAIAIHHSDLISQLGQTLRTSISFQCQPQIIRQQASCWLLDGWKLEIRSGVTSYDKGSLNIKNLHHLGTASWTPGCNCQIPNPNPTSSFATCLSILRLWRCRHWEAHPNPFREMRSASTPGIQSARCSLCRRQRNHLAGPNGHSTEVYIRAHHKWDQY